jgi:ornithine--oxo-acid transaminase
MFLVEWIEVTSSTTNGNGTRISGATHGQVTSASLICMEHEYGAHKYHPLPVVFDSA